MSAFGSEDLMCRWCAIKRHDVIRLFFSNLHAVAKGPRSRTSERTERGSENQAHYLLPETFRDPSKSDSQYGAHKCHKYHCNYASEYSPLHGVAIALAEYQ